MKWALWIGVFDIGLYRQAAAVVCLVISYRFLIKWATQKNTQKPLCVGTGTGSDIIPQRDQVYNNTFVV